MARQRRIEYSGAFYHVMARGDRREPIVQGDGDRQALMRTLSEMCERSGIRIHAYVILDNHYHLVLETPAGNLVEGMRWFQNTYTRRFNVCHQLWGHVFGGRYKALVIDDQGDYFRRAVDYVHLNPLRAGLVHLETGLERFAWSSLALLQRPPSARPEWLAADRLFTAHGLRDTARGRKSYLSILEGCVRREGREHAGRVNGDTMPGISLQTTLRRGWYFGSEQFRDQLISNYGKPEAFNKKGVSDGYHGQQMRDYGETHARTLLMRGCRALGLQPEALYLKKANDKDKVMLAELIASQTTVRLDWLREELGMKGRGHCSRLINDQRRKLRTDPVLQRQRERLVKMVKSND